MRAVGILFLALVLALWVSPLAGAAPTAADRDAYVTALETKLERWDKVVQDIRARRYPRGDFLKDGVPQKEAARVAEILEREITTIRDEIALYRRGEIEDWPGFKRGIETRLDTMRDTLGDEVD